MYFIFSCQGGAASVTFITVFNYAKSIQTDEAIYYSTTGRKLKGLQVMSLLIVFGVPNGRT